MSKYNHIKSIPIESIPQEEIKMAISEWAEGDKALENLLWICYEKGLKTSGSHAGARPFIDFKYQEGLNKIVCLFEKIQTIKGSDIYIQIDGGNPFSGDDFDKAFISLGNDSEFKEDVDSFFDMLSETLQKNMDEKKDHPLLKILNSLNDKGTSLRLRFKYNRDGNYEFSIESSIINEDRHNYYSELFKKTNMNEEIINMFEDKKRYNWRIKSNNLEEIMEKMNNISDVIESDFKLEPETDENKIIDFTLLAKQKKQTLSKNAFDNWLKAKREELLAPVNKKQVSKEPSISSDRKESKKTKKSQPIKMNNFEKKAYPPLKQKQNIKVQVGKQMQSKINVKTLKNNNTNTSNKSKNTSSNSNGFIDIIFGSIITIIIGLIIFMFVR